MAITVLQDPFQEALNQGISQAGGALAQAIQQKQLRSAEETKLANQSSAIDRAMAKIPPNPSPLDIIKFTAEAQKAGVPQEKIKGYVDIFAPGLKEQAKQQGTEDFLNRILGNRPQEQLFSEQVDVVGETPTQPGGIQPNIPAFNAISEDQLVALTATGNPQLKGLADAELKRRELNQKKFEADRKYETGIVQPYLKKIDENRDTLRMKDQALYLMQNAINEGNLSFFSRDNFANFLGQYGEGLRTAKGAQLINAQKEFLFGNLGRLKGRPNQFIEGQLLDQLPKVGRSQYANLTVTAGLQAEQDILKAKQKLEDDLVEYYRNPNNLGYVPGDLGAQADKLLDPIAKGIQEKLAYKLRVYQEQESGGPEKVSNKKVSPGTPLTLEMANFLIKKYGSKEKARMNAEKLGYKIPSKDEYERFNQ